MMFWRKEPKIMPVHDAQSEAVLAILRGAQVLPSKRFAEVVYLAILDNRDMSVADVEALGNRISRLAWNRGRR